MVTEVLRIKFSNRKCVLKKFFRQNAFFKKINEQLWASFVSTLPFLFLALNSFKKLFIEEMVVY